MNWAAQVSPPARLSAGGRPCRQAQKTHLPRCRRTPVAEVASTCPAVSNVHAALRRCRTPDADSPLPRIGPSTLWVAVGSEGNSRPRRQIPMEGITFDRVVQKLTHRGTRRRVATLVAMAATTPVSLITSDDVAARQRCKRPQAACRRSSECCGGRNGRCGHSHGGGSAMRTCCGRVGAPCMGDALGCCIPLVCGSDNRCART